MSWVKPVAKKTVTYGAKYGPHAVVVWNVAGEHVQAAARAKASEIAERRKAFREADSVVDGSVLRVVDHGTVRFVVLSGDQPVAAYPESAKPLTQLIAHADLTKRVTPRQRRERRATSRARRVVVPGSGASEGRRLHRSDARSRSPRWAACQSSSARSRGEEHLVRQTLLAEEVWPSPR